MDTVDDTQIKPMRHDSPPDAADLLCVAREELGHLCSRAGVESTLVAGSARHCGYSAREAAALPEGVHVEAFRKRAAVRIPARLIDDHVIYPGRDLLDSSRAGRPPPDRVEPNAVDNRMKAVCELRVQRKGSSSLTDQGHLRPLLIGRRRQILLAKDLWQAIEAFRKDTDDATPWNRSFRAPTSSPSAVSATVLAKAHLATEWLP
jgi:hypothetical protein